MIKDPEKKTYTRAERMDIPELLFFCINQQKQKKISEIAFCFCEKNYLFFSVSMVLYIVLGNYIIYNPIVMNNRQTIKYIEWRLL